MNRTIKPFDPAQPTHLEAVAGLWTGACGSALATSTRAVAYNLRATQAASQNGGAHIGVFAWQNDEPIGAVLIETRSKQKAVPDEWSNVGWITLAAVLPETQRQGVGTMLLDWAEEELQRRGCTVAQLGGSIRSFASGLPVELATEAFFVQRGYEVGESEWDMTANLAGYQPPPTVREVKGAVRTAQASNIDALRKFIQREFPDQCNNQLEQIIAEPQITREMERISDYMILWTERGIDGVCRLNFEDSSRPIECFYPFQLARPWGQLGQIGVSQDIRGQGFGAALIDAALRRLHNNGVNGCTISATTALDLYTKFGFSPSRKYKTYCKRLM